MALEEPVNGHANGHTNGNSNESSTYTLPLMIDGKDVHTEHKFDIVSPATDDLLWHVSGATKPEALQAVAAAETAFKKWRKSKPEARRKIFFKAADLIDSRREELEGYMAAETGAASSWTGFIVPLTANFLRDIAGRIGTIEGSIPEAEEEGKSALIYKEPYGVILAIAPWNAPYILGVRSVAYALATGNTCILKGSELSPRCMWAIGSVFKEAGLPAGCLNVIYHRPTDAPEVTTALVEHAAVRKVNFTGSTAVGSIIASLAGKHVKPVLMELGGKASTVVLADADLKKAAEACVIGAFLHAGQVCMSCERVVVDASIADAFAAELTAALDRVFDPAKPAPVMVSRTAVKKTRTLVDQALAKGAHALNSLPEELGAGGARMRPTIVDGVTPDMDLYYTESFGPSVSLIRVNGDDEAIAVANDTDYGLTAAVFTQDLRRGLRVARQIESGAVHINGMTLHDEARLPHGGVKKSGFGRFNGNYGFEEFLKTKTVTFDD